MKKRIPLLIFFAQLIILLSCTSSDQKFGVNGTWIQIHETDSGYIFIEPCDWSIPSMTIKDNSIFVEAYDGLTEFPYEVKKEGGKYVYFNEVESHEYQYLDSANGIIKESVYWKDSLTETHLYVDTLYFAKYKVYEQPCEECWGEEECEYRKKQAEEELRKKDSEEYIKSISKNKAPQKWYGHYSLPIDFEEYQDLQAYHEVIISEDSVIFSGDGSRISFRSLCSPVENGDTLNLYFKEMLEGSRRPLQESNDIILRLYKRENRYYIKSPVIITYKKGVPGSPTNIEMEAKREDLE